jgi:hypothetical protein
MTVSVCKLRLMIVLCWRVYGCVDDCVDDCDGDCAGVLMLMYRADDLC